MKNYLCLVVSFESKDSQDEIIAKLKRNFEECPNWYRGTRKYTIEWFKGLSKDEAKQLIEVPVHIA